MRVLMISKAVIVGIYQRKLERIAAHGVELLALVPPAWTDERGRMTLERAYTQGYRLETVPIVRDGDFHLHFYRGIGAQIRTFRPDIVHIDEEPYNLAAWQAHFHARRMGAKSVFFSWQNLNRTYPPPFAWGERWMLKTADAAIAGTESAAAVWRAKGFTKRIAVIPQFGTDADLFRPLEMRPERPFTVGYFGRLVEEKGIYILLEAFRQLPETTRLYLLGGGPERERLEIAIRTAGIADRVTFHPQVASTDIPAQYHRIDVLALPSLTRTHWKEQFGRVLVEAMASGVPVVGSDSGAIAGVIGDAGMIVPEGDADSLAAALRRLQNEPSLYADLAARGRARAEMYFSHEGVAADTVALYRAMLE